MRRVESDQLAQVAKLAEWYGVRWHHCRDSRSCQGSPGLPDLILVGPGGMAFRELKSSPRWMTPAQTEFKWVLKAAGADFGIWLPSHFRNGDAEALFERLGHKEHKGFELSREFPQST